MIKLVLLDPHPLVQKGFKSFFKKTKNIVVNGTFTTIKELVNFLNENTPDVVVLEMELPDGSAVDIIREIKKKYTTIAVLIFTSHSLNPFMEFLYLKQELQDIYPKK